MSGIGVINDFDISSADGVTTVFTYTAFAYDASQIKVYSVLDDVETPITTGITITPNSNFVGGTVTFAVAPSASVGKILRRREVPYTQTTEFTDIIRYKETGIEKALNTLVMQIQQLYSKVTRSMKYSEAAGTTETIIETPIDGKALIFSGTTGRLIAGPDAADIANAQGYATSALSSKNAAAVSETNANNWAIAAQNAATGINWTKARAASTANVNIASPGATLDGVTLAVNDRVLLKNQTTASQNGIYIWTGAAVAMARATDMDTWPEVVSKVVQIEEGTANADLPYMATVNTGGTIGSTSITFILFQAPLQDGAVSTALKIVDGIITYAKMLASEFATVSDIINGVASKFVNAANFKGGIRGLESYTYLGSVSASASASINMTSFITSEFDTYVFELIDLVPVTDNVSLYLRTSSNNGASWDSGASDYSYVKTGIITGSTATFTTHALSDNACVLAAALSNGAGRSFHGTVKLRNPLNASMYTTGDFNTTHSDNTNQVESYQGSFRRTSAAAVNAIQFLMASGNIASGTIRAYGIRKS